MCCLTWKFGQSQDMYAAGLRCRQLPFLQQLVSTTRLAPVDFARIFFRLTVGPMTAFYFAPPLPTRMQRFVAES